MEILESRDLARGVPIEGQQGVVGPHAVAVVHHADATLATRLELDADCARTSVERILEQLLGHRGGTLDDLAGGNLTNQLVGHDVDSWHCWRVSIGHESLSSS